jgi:hypothetical protein
LGLGAWGEEQAEESLAVGDGGLAAAVVEIVYGPAAGRCVEAGVQQASDEIERVG